MPRPSKLWRRKGRAGWWANIDGKKVCFGDDFDEATQAFHKAKAAGQRAAKPGGRVLVAVAVDRFLDEARDRVRPKTWQNYLDALQPWVDAHGRLTLDALTPDHLKEWLKRPAWSKSTRFLRGSTVKQWSKWCVDAGYLAADPLARVRLPARETRKPAADGAIEAIIAAARPEFRDFLVVLVETGCRPGEVRTLEAARIDFERSTALVEGKTGERLIGLSAKALGVLRAYAARYPTGPVLRNRNGDPWLENTAKHRMRELRLRLGLPKTVLYHARHSFWSRATKAGVPDIAIAKQLGHTDLRMLTKVYSHADHEIMADAARKASGEK